MSTNPFAGAVPLNLRQDAEKVEKSTSYRDGIVHPSNVRTPDMTPELGRNIGCTPLRRYPNGQLDVPFVAHQVIDVIHKIQDGGFVTDFERALVTLILPGQFGLMDQSLAGTMAKLSDDERVLVAVKVNAHMKEEENWNAGRGGGSVAGRSVTRS